MAENLQINAVCDTNG